MDGNSRSHDRSSQDAKAESAMRKAGETQQHCVWGGEVFFPNVQRSIKILVLACSSLVLRVKLVLIWHRFYAVWIELANLRLFWWRRARSRVLEELSAPREHQKHAMTCSVFGWHNWLFQTTSKTQCSFWEEREEGLFGVQIERERERERERG